MTTFFQSLLVHVQELRVKTGRPHCIVIDEAHHLLPLEFVTGVAIAPKELTSIALVTVHPDRISPEILKMVDGIIVVGKDPQTIVELFNKAAETDHRLDASLAPPREAGYVLAWPFTDSAGPRYVKVKLAERQLRRHRRKYAAGELGEDKSFYFRGAKGKLNLRAQNMTLFAQLAEGLDDETWDFHLSQKDYSRWLRDTIKDKGLAGVVAKIENDRNLSSAESRQLVIEAIRNNYTAA